jgi:colicin import membrane protein
MADALNREREKDRTEIKWGSMVVLSALFHVAVFCTILFVPESLPTTRPYAGVVYEVDLVELPSKASAPAPAKAKSSGLEKTARVIKEKNREVKRIAPVRKKEEPKPAVIAKRTLDKPTSSPKKPEVSATDLIERAISKVERKVEKEEHVERAISKLEKEQGNQAGPERAAQPRRRGFSLGGSTAMQIYQMEVETLIKSHWSYPVAVDHPQDLEAIVIVTVRRDGTILNTRFDKRSSNAIFDQSVEKAIERSDPLPPFPETHIEDKDEIEIHFNLSDLEEV